MVKTYCIKLLTAIFFLGIATACNNREADNKSVSNKEQITHAGTKTKLRWLAQWYGEGDKERYIREIARDFSFLNQDIELQVEFPPQVFTQANSFNMFQATCDSIIQMMKTNVWPWDVMLCDKYNYSEISLKLGKNDWGPDYFVDFSQKSWFVNSHKKGIVTEKYKTNYGGIVPGPLIEGVTNILFVSTDIEDKLGLKVKRNNMTFSEFIEYAKAVYQYNESNSPKITFMVSMNESADVLFTQLLTSAYGKLTPASRQEALNAFKEAYEALEKLAKYAPLEQHIDFSGQPFDVTRRILNEDKYLFSLQPTWVYQFWKNNNPKGVKKMIPCEIPAIDNKIAPNYSGFSQSVFCVPKASKNQEAAERLMKFIAAKENAEKWISYSKCPTGLVTHISSSDFGQGEFELFYQHIQKKYGNNQIDINIPELFFSVNKQLTYRIGDVLSGQLTAKEALTQIQKQLR